jgi:type VI secretion system secreted protein Hcp
MAVDYFLKVEGIPGESADSKHKNEIDVLSWSWGETQTGTFGVGGGGGAGKVNMQDFHFVMKISVASPKLAIACATGQHIKEATLYARKAGGEQQEFFNIKFNDLLVSSFQTGGSAHGDEVPTEQISFNYAKVKFEYKPQDATGKLGSPVAAGYDLKANKAM